MTTYRVWQEDDGDARADLRDAACPEDAATEQADYDYDNRDGWDHSWPVMYIVEDVLAGSRWKVKVFLEFDPSFYTGGAIEIAAPGKDQP